MDLKGRPFYLSSSQEYWVYSTLKSLSIKEKVGQLFCILGDVYSQDDLSKLVKEYNIGSVLFRPDKSNKLLRKYKDLDKIAKIPLLKAANLEEGGKGAISDGTYFGWPMVVGATNNVQNAKNFAEICAEEGKSIGVNWSFSPVCDLDFNYQNPITNVRSFGSNVKLVKKMTKAYVSELQKQGVAACAKHFPGDGVDFRDHHLHASINSLSAKKWWSTYGNVYKNLIENDLLSVMVGHIKQYGLEKEIDPNIKYENVLPASLSKNLLTGVLREKLGFNGLITTDATIMAGFTQALERKIAIPTAISAGADMLVFSLDIFEDINYLIEGIENNIVSIERIDEAVTRVLALKAKITSINSKTIVRNKKEKISKVSDEAITLVKNRSNILPISPNKYPTIRLILLGNDIVEKTNIKGYIKEKLEKEGFEVEIYNRENDELKGTSSLNKKRLTLYFANEETASNRVCVRLSWNPKHALDVPRHIHEEDSVFVSLYNPYHLQDVPCVPVYINTYSPTLINIDNTLEKLLGRSEFKGKSPVDAFCGLIDTKY